MIFFGPFQFLSSKKPTFILTKTSVMKKALRYLLIVIGIIVVLVGGFAAFVSFRGIPKYTPENFSLKVASSPERVERGRQLSSMLCNDCHMNANTGKLTGRKMDEISQFGAIHSRNLTNDPEHGIGKMTDGQLYYLLRTGVRPDGRFLPIMAKLQKMSDEDLQSVIAFLRSDNPWVQGDATPNIESKYSFLSKFLTTMKLIKPMPFYKSVPEPDTTNQVKWGEYVSLYRVECYTCHSADFTTDDFINPEKSKGFFGGGNLFHESDNGRRNRNWKVDRRRICKSSKNRCRSKWPTCFTSTDETFY
jgi:hypothetical protein